MKLEITDLIISSFFILWSVIDPIGTIPVFIEITKKFSKEERKRIAKMSSLVAFSILLFFLLVGEYILKNAGVPLAAFQTSGGIILFLFAMNMIFGNSKPEEEIQLINSGHETAIFPLAIPSIASPGAILAVVLLADSSRGSVLNQTSIILVLLFVLLINYILMRLSYKIHEKIGDSGAIIISKVMGLILASIAANNILMGIKVFFKIQ